MRTRSGSLGTDRSHTSIPPRVDYELTKLGRSLLGPVTALTDWAIANMPEIHQAQERFDAEREDSIAA